MDFNGAYQGSVSTQTQNFIARQRRILHRRWAHPYDFARVSNETAALLQTLEVRCQRFQALGEDAPPDADDFALALGYLIAFSDEVADCWLHYQFKHAGRYLHDGTRHIGYGGCGCLSLVMLLVVLAAAAGGCG